MKTKATSAEDYKLVTSYEEARKTLLDDKFTDRLDKPLAFWTLPNDRRLPLAFLGRTLRDLLTTPFDELSATPGVGQKKISTLVKLLHRATRDNPPVIPFEVKDLAAEARTENTSTIQSNGRPFDPAIVSEALWVLWRDAVKEHTIGTEKLGRLAPSLQTLPTVIWHVPLSQYLAYSLAEIRQLRTHGEKRVRAVLEVFHAVHEKLANTNSGTDLAIRLLPKHIAGADGWIAEVRQSDALPGPQQLCDRLAIPLLEQIRIDSGPTVHRLAEQRLGIDDDPRSVRTQAREMGVTRARIYQLLDDCSKVINVRWPEGRSHLEELATQLRQRNAAESEMQLLYATRDLFFPDKHQRDALDDGENGRADAEWELEGAAPQ